MADTTRFTTPLTLLMACLALAACQVENGVSALGAEPAALSSGEEEDSGDAWDSGADEDEDTDEDEDEDTGEDEDEDDADEDDEDQDEDDEDDEDEEVDED